MTSTNPNKPFTANFELQTKIRVIIQQVLAATIRKLSLFNQKIDKFEDYFIVYKQKVQTIQKKCTQNSQTISSQFEERMKLNKQLSNQQIRSQQVQQKNLMSFEQVKNQVKQLSRVIKQIQRQNQNLNNELSKTKGKFLQYSNVISSLKQQVSWKIIKYIQETAQTNTEIKINNQLMRKQYFNLMLMLQKQKEKYDKIIEMNQRNQNNTKQIFEDMQRLQGYNKTRFQQNKKTLDKLDQYDTILQAKLKTLDNKCELRISELEKDNRKSMNAAKKLQTFNDQLQQIKAQQQKIRLQFIKKIQDTTRKTKEQSQVQIVKISKQLLKIEKNAQKKLAQLKESTQKAEEFLAQKIDFMKMQMQTQISTHTNKLIQQKQNSSKVNSSTMQQIGAKIGKFNIQIQKQIVKVENSVKQVKYQIKKQIQNLKDNVESKIQYIQLKPRKISEEEQISGDKKISPQLLNQIQQFSIKISAIHQKLNKKDKQIAQIRQNEGKNEIFKKGMMSKIDEHFKSQEQQISGKVQKIMFLVTKMRGDGIIRNEFTEKQIREIKRNQSEYRQNTDTILKLMPAFGQCINLILALIYDAEYQHSKIIQQNLPMLKKNEQKFNTCVQGVLYQFKEKRKAGVICYRHKDVRKTQIVKATFNAYIRVWEDLFQNQFKNKLHYMPKGFYKKAVQKVVNGKDTNQKQDRKETSVSPNKQSAYFQKITSSAGFSKPSQQLSNFTPFNSKRQQPQREHPNYSQSLLPVNLKQTERSLKKIEEEHSINDSSSNFNQDNQINSSFHIRRKKNTKKDEVIVMNVIQPGVNN